MKEPGFFVEAAYATRRAVGHRSSLPAPGGPVSTLYRDRERGIINLDGKRVILDFYVERNAIDLDRERSVIDLHLTTHLDCLPPVSTVIGLWSTLTIKISVERIEPPFQFIWQPRCYGNPDQGR